MQRFRRTVRLVEGGAGSRGSVDQLPPPPLDPAKEIAESLRREAEYEAQQAALAEHLSETQNNRTQKPDDHRRRRR